MGKSKDIPWMFPKERDILLEIFENFQPKKCLEWGSGFSTFHFPLQLNDLQLWMSIEHDERWFKLMKSKKLANNVEIKHIPLPSSNFVESKKNQYVDYPQGVFDLIFIDGKLRDKCMEKSLNLLSDKSLVILHDANRKHYHESMKLYKYQVLLSDHRNAYGGIWLGSNSIAIEKVFDVEYFKKIWKKHLFFTKLFRPNLWGKSFLQ